MTDLISRLNALATLTPDEIVSHLDGNGWVKGADLTADRYEKLVNQSVRVITYDGDAWYNHGTYVADWGASYVVRNLPNHWFKLVSEYGGEDDRPNRSA